MRAGIRISWPSLFSRSLNRRTIPQSSSTAGKLAAKTVASGAARGDVAGPRQLCFIEPKTLAGSPSLEAMVVKVPISERDEDRLLSREVVRRSRRAKDYLCYGFCGLAGRGADAALTARMDDSTVKDSAATRPSEAAGVCGRSGCGRSRRSSR